MPQEVSEMIFIADDQEIKAIISLLYITGARISEILNLNNDDITYHTENNSKYIRLRIRTLKQKKTGSPFVRLRFLEFNINTPFIINFIEYLPSRAKHDKVFTRYRELAYYYIKKTNRYLSPHAFRHSRAQKFADIIVNPFKLMALTGHVDIKNVMKYVDTSKIALKEFRDKYD